MSEVINVVVALAVIVFVFRWAVSSSETEADRSTRATLGFRPKNVTTGMIDTVSSMFPDMPRDNIRYDLLRTGNVETTTNKIIERGFLDPPPAAYYRIYPRNEQQGQATNSRGAARAGAAGGAGSSSVSKGPSLIQRFHLETRLQDEAIPEPEKAGGKASWESTPEQREASLKERKAQMILAARKRLLEQQQRAQKA